MIEVASRGRDLAEEQLRTLLKRKDVGLATTRDVLEGEEDLAEARTELTAAFADYNKAVTDYLRVTGQLLEHAGVRFTAAVEADRDGSLLGVE
jgi:outer membrane protein TolC